MATGIEFPWRWQSHGRWKTTKPISSSLIQNNNNNNNNNKSNEQVLKPQQQQQQLQQDLPNDLLSSLLQTDSNHPMLMHGLNIKECAKDIKLGNNKVLVVGIIQMMNEEERISSFANSFLNEEALPVKFNFT